MGAMRIAAISVLAPGLALLSSRAHAAALDPTLAADVLATFQSHASEFEHCFVEFEPAVPSAVTVQFDIRRDGYGLHAVIVRGRAGLDSPGLCLVDQFELRPGVHFASSALRGRRLRAEFRFDPTAQPRLRIALR